MLNSKVQIDDYDKQKKYARHPEAHKNGGFHMNLVEDTRVMSVVGSVLKQIGQKMAKGDFNLATLIKPIQLTHHLSMLELLANDYTYNQFYNLAAQTKDPLLRMQYVVCLAIAGIHVNQYTLKSKAPTDCILGETIQLERSDGSRFYAEFIKSDPPTSLIQLFGPNDDYKLWATDEVYAEIHPTFTQIVGRTVRKRTLQFKDGKIFEISMPTMIIEGVLNGDRILNFMDTFEISSTSDNLYAKVSFSFQYQGKVSKIAKKLTGYLWAQNDNKPLQDLVDIEIQKKVNIDDEEQMFTLSTGSGSWLSFVQFDQKIMWRFDDPYVPWQSVNKYLLPSDSTLRLDRKYLIENQLDQAQKARYQIEEDERKFSKLRK